MSNPFNIGIFNGPRYSSFPWSHDNKISMSAGKITPIAWEFLNTGDKIEADVANVVRLAPMVAPTLDTYRVDIHAFALRLRSLGNATRNPWVYEDFFNLNKNQDGSKSLPMIPLRLLFAANGFQNGTLIESLGFPTFKKDRDSYLEFLRNKHPYVFDPVVSFTSVANGTNIPDDLLSFGFYPASLPGGGEPTYDSPYIRNFNYEVIPTSDRRYSLSSNSYYRRFYPTVQDTSFVFPFVGTLISFVAYKYPEVFSSVAGLGQQGISYDTLGAYLPGVSYALSVPLPEEIKDVYGMNVLDKVFELYKVDSISVMKEFEDWLLEGFLGLSYNPQSSSDASLSLYGYDSYSIFKLLADRLEQAFYDLPTSLYHSQNLRSIPTYPFDCYYKILSDWYINTALTDPDSFFSSHSFSVLLSANTTAAQKLALVKSLNTLFKRFWSNDYFTSAFPSPQAGQAVGIPVNGTIIDLRNANAMQKLKERLLYAGSRFRDVLFAITGKHTSSAILEMSEVLGSWSNVINVDSVLQQSETTNGSPQAGYAGTGLGYRAGGKDFRYTAEEPTVIMVFASIVPIASYFQGLSRKFLRANVYDYAIPQLANVGEQRILRGELYIGSDSPSGASDSAQTFGFTRRNGDFMWTPSEIHGDFRGSLDYWHNARIFGSSPSLSENFLQVNPVDDNLNRVFAVQSDSYDHFYCNFSFTGHVVRSLPKHVHYDL